MENIKGKKLLNTTFSFFLILSLCLCMISTACTESNNNPILKQKSESNILPNEESQKIKQIDGYISDSSDLEAFFKDAPILSSVSDTAVEYSNLPKDITKKASLSDIELTINEGRVILNGELTVPSGVQVVKSEGIIYQMKQTKNTANPGELILVEMSDFEGYHFVQFRLDKDVSQRYGKQIMQSTRSWSLLSIFLESKETHELILFEMPIDVDIFNQIYAEDNKSELDDSDYEMKIINLLSVNRNLLSFDEESSYFIFEDSSGEDSSGIATALPAGESCP